MDSIVPLERVALEAQVRTAFADGPPNGWLLGWPEDRGFDEFSRMAAPHKPTNHTSFDYAFCNHFDVRVDEPDANGYVVLTLLMSFVADVFSLHWTAYQPGGQGGRVVSEYPKASSLETRVRSWLAEKGFMSIPDDLFNMELPGVALELSGSQNVTLGKCLFRDHEG
jgi:hypothetical protein